MFCGLFSKDGGKMAKPIRVLCVFASLDRGGAETMAMNVYRKIDREKVQFDFVKMVQKECAYEREIEALGGQVFLCPRLEYFNYFKFRRWWVDFFSNHRDYKIIHCHFFTVAGFVFPIARRFGLATICHSHTAKKRRHPMHFVCSILAQATSDYCLACSKDAGDYFFPKRKDDVIEVKNGIDTITFKFDSELRNDMRLKLGLTDKYIIGHIGRFHEAKNHQFLIDLFSHIHQKKPNSVLLLLGDGPLRPEMEAKANALGLGKCVHFLGVQTQVHRYLNAMDLFLFPSKYEGFPVALVEAQCNGMHCIASDTVSKECNITGNVDFVPLIEDKWIDAILKLKEERDLQAPYKIKSAGFDIMETARHLQEFYMELSEGR